VAFRCRVRTSTLRGVEALPVEVEVDIGPGLPGFAIVGLPDVAVQEARDRVRSAIKSSGFQFPNGRVLVNLAPAPLRKHGTGFDLPIALGILAATSQVPVSVIAECTAVGELSLDGALRPVSGMLAHALSALAQNLALAGPDTDRLGAVVPGLRCRPIERLRDALTPAPPAATARPSAAILPRAADLAEVAGQQLAKRALVIAAAGGHNLLMVGPPGAGKTMLARRLPGILPELSAEERIETALVYSVAGLDDQPALGGIRPFRAPHHAASIAGLVGGGSPPKPGEVSLAHHGVLFLDELPEFGPAALQALRQPLEDGWVALVRADGRIRFPASFGLVAAANPCPCGFFGDSVRTCSCTPAIRSRYIGRIGGPLLDRIDLCVRVDRVAPDRLLDPPSDEDSRTARDLVDCARGFASSAGRPPSSALSGAALVAACRLSPATTNLLSHIARTYHLSGRGITRTLRVARTIADLGACTAVDAQHLNEAAMFRGEEVLG
jgi:magnesium chelatase family protein